jgi:hypothetical protein
LATGTGYGGTIDGAGIFSSLTPYLLGISIMILKPFSVNTVYVGMFEFNGFYFKSNTNPRP